MLGKFKRIFYKFLQKSRLRYDLIAGISVASLLLPEAIAYSSIAGLPAETGVIAILAGLVAYGILGKSRFAIVAPTSSSAAIIAAAVLSVIDGSGVADIQTKVTLASALVLLTGFSFVLAAILKLGKITSFIAKPVLRGFVFGLAIIIVLKQLILMLEVRPVHSDVFRMVAEIFKQMPDWNWFGLVLGLMTVALLFILSRFKRLPFALIVFLTGIVIGKLLSFGDFNISVIGSITPRFSSPVWPDLSFDTWLRLGEIALALTMILYAESYGSIRTFASKHDDPVSPNRDLFALGCANLLSGLFRGMPVGAGYSATAANEAYGAKTRLSGLFAAVMIFFILLVLLPSIAMMPISILAAIVVYAVSHTLNPKYLKPYFYWKRDRFLVIVAIFAVLVLGVLDGLLVSIVISIILMLYQLSIGSVVRLGRFEGGHDFVSKKTFPEAQEEPDILILRPTQQLFFANAERIFAEIRHEVESTPGSVHSVIISLEESSNIDSTSVEVLIEFSQHMRDAGKKLVLARLKEPVFKVLRRVKPAILPLDSLMEFSVDEAVCLVRREQPETEIKQQ